MGYGISTQTEFKIFAFMHFYADTPRKTQFLGTSCEANF